MATKTDPERAFPKITGFDGKTVTGTGGMSIRDFFAAMALAGMHASGGKRDPVADAETAYGAAEAMLTARQMHPE